MEYREALAVELYELNVVLRADHDEMTNWVDSGSFPDYNLAILDLHDVARALYVDDLIKREVEIPLRRSMSEEDQRITRIEAAIDGSVLHLRVRYESREKDEHKWAYEIEGAYSGNYSVFWTVTDDPGLE